jgi:integrase
LRAVVFFVLQRNKNRDTRFALLNAPVLQHGREVELMGVFLRGNMWWYEFHFRGQRIRETSHSSVKAVCLRLERERRRQLELGTQGLSKVAQPMLFSRAVKSYLLEREAHWSRKTREMHTNSLRHLEPHFGKLLLNEIRGEQVSRYQRARLKEGASNRTANIEVNLLRLVLRKKKLWSNIASDVTMLKERTDIGRELSDDEVHRLLLACKGSASRGLYPAVLTSIHTGLRSQELRMLRWHQVDLLEGIITVGRSKTQAGEGRLVYLSALAVQTLKNWRSEFPSALPSHAVFPREAYGLRGRKGTFGGQVVPFRTFPDQPVRSFATAWKAAKNAAGVECRWHDLRHSAASRMAAGGATDQTLQALLGWMSSKMIERYSHVRAEAKRKAVSVFDMVSSEEDSPQKSPQSRTREPS